MIGKDKKRLCSSWNKTSPVTRFYLRFSALCLLMVVILGRISFTKAESVSQILPFIMQFVVIYLVAVTIIATLNLILVMGAMYELEKNIIAALVPLLLTIIGLILAFWLYDEDALGHLTFQAISWKAASVLVFASSIGATLNKTLGMKFWKLYILGFFQIMLTIIICAVLL